LSPEHIESHGGFENYRNEKLKLFTATKNIHVINVDDKNAEYFLNIPAKTKIKFSIKDNQNYKLKLNLLGDFNIMNALAAMNVAEAYEIKFEICKKVLENAKGIPGRMEKVSENPDVIVDYAHTPEQLEAVYKSLNNKPLICVLGSCGGGRDKWKRPVLGEIANKYCKEVIITNEDPYDENPLSIIKEIESALSNDGASPKHQIILDRKEAIKKAIELAKPEDTVIITGKGSEPWMCIANGKKIPWDDRGIVKEIIKNK
jgi:UDP-N-acetylmuramoyl-L-alanyl-D-glutamate--2,6-diaminopimelate ligase